MTREEAINAIKAWDFLNNDEKEVIETLIPELVESEDEKVRKGLINYFNDFRLPTFGGLELKKILAWLEKQESVEEIVERCKNSWYNEGKIQGQIEGLSDEEKYQQGWHDALENQGVYEPTKNVEPKFKVSDWCIDTKDGTIFQIIRVLSNTYTYKTNEGKVYSCTHYSLENDARLWSIADAKDGDVLVSNSSIFIFNCEYAAGKPEAYCGVINGKFYNGEGCWTNEKCYPTTKEQRDQLEKAMANAGYTFDFEKKALKIIDWSKHIKYEPNSPSIIEEKSDWSEEDEKTLQGIWDEILANKHDAKEYEWKTYDKFLNWLKYLKYRIRPQSKQEWSEEDEIFFNDIIVFLKDTKNALDHADWLKSLKERYTWKPSDELMYYLSWIAKTKLGDSVVEQRASKYINKLLEDLKKLR